MTVPTDHIPDNPRRPEPSATPSPQSGAGGLGRLATRISAWTSRALVTLMIVVAALAVGRQTIEWWRASPPSPPAPPATPDAAQVGNPDLPHVLQLGDSPWAILRQTVTGDETLAAKTLTTLSRTALEQTEPLVGPPTDAERRFLATLNRQPPSEKQPGRWALYQVPAGFPVLVGVRPTRSAANSDDQDVALAASRVVTWAIAAPSADAGWNLYVFYPEKGAVHSTPGLLRVPVPPGTNQTLTIRALGGGAVVGFKGSPAIPAWTEFYDQWFAERGWSASGWQSATNGWHAHYRSPASDTATADVRFGADGSGLIVVGKGV
jgi:hypothetical protein